MQHVFDYELHGKKKRRYSTMILQGKSMEDTAIARTVGLPIGVFAKLVMLGKITDRGIKVPVSKEAYLPVLNELEELGMKFEDKEEEING